MSLNNMEKQQSSSYAFKYVSQKLFKTSKIQSEFLPKYLGRNDTVWLLQPQQHCGRGR